MTESSGQTAGRSRPARGSGRVSLRDPVHRVSRKAIALWLMEGAVWTVLLVVGSVLLAAWIGDARWSWLPGWIADEIGLLPWAVGVALGVLTVTESLWRYAVHRWELTGDVVYARSGWLSRDWVFVPVSRIQTVDKAQGWFERLLGLATVEIRTASHAGSSTIKGLDYGVAAGLAEELARRAEELRDDAT
ncbi:PH domain-containing protein [Planomonospora sp. ID82291]|uniref:PH domain-containing protein n=1 Tax=Planomonospora sp. ID82291 TaxID=2738136 RepID=UPI0018C44189|nr:PH domain-containing protein [Planomonospora sp. ID82291]MBG0818149.1 PH domain-containing protein [Planomonospora sp. ID82291]